MSEVTVRKQRPKHLALHEIRLPLPGIVSILHRVSGVGLFLMLPFLLYLLDLSLGSAESFETFSAVVGHPLAK
ncbi:MAG: succinate dehydrogenase, cytochrome b556 subunit, partial [Betaproteobacteria bacterium HGW-Betaproteobacteria-19]